MNKEYLTTYNIVFSNATNALNILHEKFLKDNIALFKNKDRKLLELPKYNITSTVSKHLLDIWNYLYYSRENSLSTYNTVDLSYFARSRLDKLKDSGYFDGMTDAEYNREVKRILRLNDFYDGAISKEEFIANTKKSKQNYQKELSNWWTSNKSSEFKNYLQKRYDVIGYNYNQEYHKKLSESISNYLNSNITKTDFNEKKLLNALSLNNFQNLNQKEIEEYFRTPNKTITNVKSKIKANQIPKEYLANVKRRYGLANKDGNIGQDGFETLDSQPLYQNNILNRLDRIVQTEMNASYNIKTLGDALDKGYTSFIWKSDTQKDQCILCRTANGQEIFLNDIINLKQFNTFKNIKTRHTYNSNKNKNGLILPPVHPYCNCVLIPNKKQPPELITNLLNTAKSKLLNMGSSYALSEETKQIAKNNKELKDKKRQDNITKIILGTVGITSIGLLTYMFVKNRDIVTENIKEGYSTLKDLVEENIQQKVDKIIQEKLDNIKTKEEIKEDYDPTTDKDYLELKYNLLNNSASESNDRLNKIANEISQISIDSLRLLDKITTIKETNYTPEEKEDLTLKYKKELKILQDKKELLTNNYKQEIDFNLTKQEELSYLISTTNILDKYKKGKSVELKQVNNIVSFIRQNIQNTRDILSNIYNNLHY